MKEERRKQMGDLVARVQRLSMEQLRDHFGVSMNTIRSDVAYLVQTGAVEKVYGGVRAAEYRQVPVFESRAMEHTSYKRRIAAAAADLIEDRDIIFIDAGTTTMHLIDRLSSAKRVTIVTGNLYVIEKATEKENINLIVLPGVLNRRTNSLADMATLEHLARYRFNKAFMGVSGVSEEGNLNVSTYMEHEIKRTALKQSRSCYLLADSGKFSGAGLMSYGSVMDMDVIITDQNCPEFIKNLCRRSNIQLLQV